MITAGITAIVAGLLSLFGIKPGPYLVGVAIGVKIIVVGVGVILGSRVMRRRAAAKAAPTPAMGHASSSDSSTAAVDQSKMPPDPERAGRG